MKRFQVLFLIILFYFAVDQNDALKKKKKPSKGPSFQMNKSIEYYIREDLDKMINVSYAHVLMTRYTCLSFTRTSDNSTREATVIKDGSQCGTSAKIIGKKIRYFITLNKNCSRRDMVLKYIFWSAMMRYQLTKCIKTNKHYQQFGIKGENIVDLIAKYHCDIEGSGDAKVKFSDNSLKFLNSYKPKKSGIKPEDLQQKDYSLEISFSNIKHLNNKFCKESCPSWRHKKCKNNGYPYPKNCGECLCPFFYDGKRCENFMKPKKPYYCGSSSLTATSKNKIKVLDLSAECYYKIKPSSKYKKIKIRFKPKGDLHWNCEAYKLIEIKYLKDKSKVGLIPCGKLKEFTVKSEKRADVLLYHSKIAQESKIIMEYKTVSK